MVRPFESSKVLDLKGYSPDQEVSLGLISLVYVMGSGCEWDVKKQQQHSIVVSACFVQGVMLFILIILCKAREIMVWCVADVSGESMRR